MNESFQKARRSLALLSGILIVWEYIGITLPKNLKLPGADNTVGIGFPEAIPGVILVILLYFAVRLSLEWFQRNKEDRQQPAARIDLGLSYMLALVAVVIYSIQKLSTLQLAATIEPIEIVLFIMAWLLWPVIYVPTRLNRDLIMRAAKRSRLLRRFAPNGIVTGPGLYYVDYAVSGIIFVLSSLLVSGQVIVALIVGQDVSPLDYLVMSLLVGSAIFWGVVLWIVTWIRVRRYRMQQPKAVKISPSSGE